MAGYWNKPEQTAEAMIDGGWYRTGDVGYLDDDGYLYLVDRAKDMIISGGENVYCTEVEDALYTHPVCSRRPSSASPTNGGVRPSTPSSCRAPCRDDRAGADRPLPRPHRRLQGPQVDQLPVRAPPEVRPRQGPQAEPAGPLLGRPHPPDPLTPAGLLKRFQRTTLAGDLPKNSGGVPSACDRPRGVCGQSGRRCRAHGARRGARVLPPVVRRQPDVVVGLLRHDGPRRDPHRAHPHRHGRRRRRHADERGDRGGPRHDQPTGARTRVLRRRHRQHGEPRDGRQTDADRRVRALHRGAARTARRRGGRRRLPR